MANVHTKFTTPTPPHFFKIILQKTLHDNKIQIPKTFWVKHCGSLSNQVFLKLPCGSTWEVGLTKTSDGKIWIENGWNKFAQHCSLSWGNFLVFRYEGDSQFHVIIFNLTTTEIDYPSNPNNLGNHNVESTEVLDSFPRNPKTRDKSPLPCSQLHKKIKTSVSCKPQSNNLSLPRISTPKVMQKDSLSSKVDKSAPKRYQKPSSEIEKHNADDTKDGISIQAMDKSPIPCSARPHKKMKASPDYGTKSKVMKWDMSDKECGESSLPRWMKPEIFLSRQILSANEKAEAVKRVKDFQSKDPFFMVYIQPSGVGANYNVIIPSIFASQYLLNNINKHGDVILKVEDGRTWSVRYCFSRRKRASKTKFQRGWKAFTQENDLKVGDVCAFVLRESIGIMLFEVVIFCGNGVQKSAMPKSCNNTMMINRRSGLKQTTVLERGSSSQSERPSFTVIMHETYATGHCYFVLPYKFVEKYIKKKECEVRLSLPDGRCWFVQLKVRQANACPRAELCRGWREFALDNSLQAGDICKFELTIDNGNEVSFKVSIEKDHDDDDDAYNMKVANKRKAITPSKLKRNPYVKVESSFAHHNMNIKKEQVEIKVEPNISDMSMKLKSDNQGRASKVASKFFSNNPYFHVVLRSNHVYGFKLPFPSKFAIQYLEGKAKVMSLWVGEKYWDVKLMHFKSSYEFGAGWAAFAVENSLMPKDVCIFELINNNQAEMKVHIFRESGLALALAQD
ncbi:hypothetical protein CsatA_014114 [Cannabis sativa]